MKNLLLLLLLLLFTSKTVSQTYDWAINLGNWNNDYLHDLEIASDGIVFLTNVHHVGSNALKGLYKYDFDGNEIWKFQFINNATYGFADIIIDSQDNIYGVFAFGTEGETYNYNGTLIHGGLSLIKIDTNGNILWNRNLAGISYGFKIIMINDNVFVIGEFSETISINNEVNITSQQYWDCFSNIYRYAEDIYIAKFSTEGVLLDVMQYGSEYTDHLIDAIIDENSIIFLHYKNYHSCSNRTSAMTRLDLDLNILWEKNITEEIPNTSDLFYPTNVYLSIEKEIFVWGYNFNSITIGDFQIPNQENCGASGNLVKYDYDDGEFIQIRNYNLCTDNDIIGVISPGILGKSRAFMQESEDNLILYTTFSSPVDLDNGTFSPFFYPHPNGNIYSENILFFSVKKETFESKYLVHFEGDLPSQYSTRTRNLVGPFKIHLDKIYFSASFEEKPLYIYGNSVNNNSGNGAKDALVAKIGIDAILSSNDIEKQHNFVVYPNPSNDFIKIISEKDIQTVRIFNVEGKQYFYNDYFNQNQIEIYTFSKGVYFVEVTFEDESIGIKKVVKK
jgi:hypothetical protein